MQYGFDPRIRHYIYGSVVQLVRMLACHARGHGFESRQSRLWHLPLTGQESRLRKQESDEQRSQVRLLPAFQPENVGSSPAGVTTSASSPAMRVRFSQRKYGSVVQFWLEHPPVTRKVTGSSPVRVAIASVAQLVERMPEEHGVAGSTPAGGTNIFPFRLMVGHRSLKPRMEVRFFQRKL